MQTFLRVTCKWDCHTEVFCPYTDTQRHIHTRRLMCTLSRHPSIDPFLPLISHTAIWVKHCSREGRKSLSSLRLGARQSPGAARLPVRRRRHFLIAKNSLDPPHPIPRDPSKAGSGAPAPPQHFLQPLGSPAVRGRLRGSSSPSPGSLFTCLQFPLYFHLCLPSTLPDSSTHTPVSLTLPPNFNPSVPQEVNSTPSLGPPHSITRNTAPPP